MKTAEEILKKVCRYDNINPLLSDNITVGEAIKAMEEYAKQFQPIEQEQPQSYQVPSDEEIERHINVEFPELTKDGYEVDEYSNAQIRYLRKIEYNSGIKWLKSQIKAVDPDKEREKIIEILNRHIIVYDGEFYCKCDTGIIADEIMKGE